MDSVYNVPAYIYKNSTSENFYSCYATALQWESSTKVRSLLNFSPMWLGARQLPKSDSKYSIITYLKLFISFVLIAILKEVLSTFHKVLV
jgi:hypothetical protein